MNYERVYEWYIDKAIERMIDERVMYAELRPMLLDKTIQADNGDSSVTLEDQMRMISRAMVKKKQELDKEARGHLFPFGLKIIYCTPRSIPEKMMNNEIKDCIRLKKLFPELICGASENLFFLSLPTNAQKVLIWSAQRIDQTISGSIISNLPHYKRSARQKVLTYHSCFMPVRLCSTQAVLPSRRIPIYTMQWHSSPSVLVMDFHS